MQAEEYGQVYESSFFSRFSRGISRETGHPRVFVLAVIIIFAWLITGPVVGFSDTWQLVINTGTTIVTFLMVFLIQNTQNRDSEALHLKLDEIVRTLDGASNALLDMEELDEKQLDLIRERYQRLARAEHNGSGPPQDAATSRAASSPAGSPPQG